MSRNIIKSLESFLESYVPSNLGDDEQGLNTNDDQHMGNSDMSEVLPGYEITKTEYMEYTSGGEKLDSKSKCVENIMQVFSDTERWHLVEGDGFVSITSINKEGVLVTVKQYVGSPMYVRFTNLKSTQQRSYYSVPCGDEFVTFLNMLKDSLSL
jgi:hypothetical protein